MLLETALVGVDEVVMHARVEHAVVMDEPTMAWEERVLLDALGSDYSTPELLEGRIDEGGVVGHAGDAEVQTVVAAL